MCLGAFSGCHTFELLEPEVSKGATGKLHICELQGLILPWPTQRGYQLFSELPWRGGADRAHGYRLEPKQ